MKRAKNPDWKVSILGPFTIKRILSSRTKSDKTITDKDHRPPKIHSPEERLQLRRSPRPKVKFHQTPVGSRAAVKKMKV
jgi:hypothetical protein